MKSKETLLKEYFEDVKPDFRASVRYGIPYFDTNQERIIDVDFDKYEFGNVLEIYPDDLEQFDVNVDTVFYHTKDLKKLAWLFKRTAKLINDLRKADKGWIGEIEEDKTMTLKVFLTDDSIVTIHDMSAEDFRQLIAQSTDWVSLDNMTVSVWDKGKGCININKIVTFVEQKDEECK